MRHRDIIRSRLAGQFLTTRGPTCAAELVRTLGAVQAQDYAGAKWGLALRLRDVTEATIEREIDEGRILRTHVLRPTWHFVAATDIRWLLALTGPRVSAAMAPANRRLELDAAVFRKSRAVFERALAGGGYLTRTELRGRLERAGLTVGTGQRLAHLVMQAEVDGILGSGPRRGKQFTYALLDGRAPPGAAFTRDEALLELTRRYFSTRGPATARDFAWWSGLTVSDARRGLDLLGGSVERMAIGDETYWRTGDGRSARHTASAHLLPNFDEYFIGYRDRSAIAARSADVSSVMVTNALVPHVIIVDGELVGTWKRDVEKERVVVRLRYQTGLTEVEVRRIAAAAAQFSRYLGLDLAIETERMSRGAS